MDQAFRSLNLEAGYHGCRAAGDVRAGDSIRVEQLPDPPRGADAVKRDCIRTSVSAGLQSYLILGLRPAGAGVRVLELCLQLCNRYECSVALTWLWREILFDLVLDAVQFLCIGRRLRLGGDVGPDRRRHVFGVQLKPILNLHPMQLSVTTKVMTRSRMRSWAMVGPAGRTLQARGSRRCESP